MLKIDKKTTIYLVSPHLDDAIFSAGGLILKYSKTHKIVLVNVFTSPGASVETMSSKKFLNQIGYTNKSKLFEDRKKEDQLAAKLSGIYKVINLDFTDALWREKSKTVLGKLIPELGRVYPTYRFHVIKGKASKHDNALIHEISQELKKVVSQQNSVIFCPMGFGNHVDHIVVRDACRLSFEEKQLVYWSDYPYIDRSNSKTNFYKDSIFDKTLVEINSHKKTRICQQYISQYKQVIGDLDIKDSETFYHFLAPKFKPNLQNLLYALVKQPKNTIFNLLNYKKSPVIVKPFSIEDYKVANLLVKKIRSILPKAKVHLIGSQALKSPGQGDIDLIVGVQSSQIDKSLTALSKTLGKPTKKNTGFIQWKIKYQGRSVDLDLLESSGVRFNLQLSQIKKIKSSVINLSKYRELKYSTSQSNKFWYSIARIIFFHKLISDKNHLEQFRHVKEINTDKHVGAYKFAIYTDKSGNKVFVKKWSGLRKNLTYYWLKNEISVYKLLKNYSRRDVVFTPKPIFIHEDKSGLYLGLEYLKGKDLEKLNPKQKLSIFQQSINYLNKVYASASKNDLRSITHREPLYWLLVLPAIALKAILLHPKHAGIIIRRVIETYSKAPVLLLRKQRTLVHRDFNNYNCFLYKNRICLIDFQLTCIADPMVEYAVIALKYFDNDEIKSEVINLINSDSTSKYSLATFKTYLNIFAIYDLSLSDGSHFLSLPAVKEQVKI